MIEHIDKLINSRNMDLWLELNKEYDFILEESPEPNYMSRVEDKKATIRIYQNDLTPSPFTHELLHVFLKSKNVLIQYELFEAVKGSDELKTIISFELIEHIGNSLEHSLILPIFLKMGFEKEDFLSDFKEKKMTDKELKVLKSNFKINRVYRKESVDFFIGKFFAMKSCNNKAFKYYKYFVALEKLDCKLYKLLHEFWEDWLTFDFTNPNDTYEVILENFLLDINHWLSNKTII
jgi:hypothetical protein